MFRLYRTPGASQSSAFGKAPILLLMPRSFGEGVSTAFDLGRGRLSRNFRRDHHGRTTYISDFITANVALANDL